MGSAGRMKGTTACDRRSVRPWGWRSHPRRPSALVTPASENPRVCIELHVVTDEINIQRMDCVVHSPRSQISMQISLMTAKCMVLIDQYDVCLGRFHLMPVVFHNPPSPCKCLEAQALWSCSPCSPPNH